MSAADAQIQFAAEFVTFLVAAAGLALVVLSAEATETWWDKLALAVGFVAMGVAAFGHGSLLFKAHDAALVRGLRLTGVVGVLIGTLRWRGGPLTRALTLLGVALTAGSVAADASGAARLADGLLAAGSIGARRRRPRRQPPVDRGPGGGQRGRDAAARRAGLVGRAVGRAVVIGPARGAHPAEFAGSDRGRAGDGQFRAGGTDGSLRRGVFGERRARRAGEPGWQRAARCAPITR